MTGYLGDNDFGGRHIHQFGQLVATLLAHGILLRPGARSGLILGPVSLVHVSNLRDKRVIWVGISKQGADRKQDLKHKKTMVVSDAATH